MEANIIISGLIGEVPFETGPFVSLDNIRNHVDNVEGLTSITATINSPGGSLTEGYAIYDYLRGLGVPITTIGTGIVGSIATVIYLAGDRRYLTANARFLIHNPIPAYGIQTDAEGYERLAGDLRKEEDELINFYRSRTGIPADEIRALMNEDKPITAREAVNLGFSDAIRVNGEEMEEVKMVACYFSKTTQQMQKQVELINKKDSEMSLREQLKKLLNSTEEVADQVEVTEVEETQDEAPAIDWEAKYKELEAQLNEQKESQEAEQTEVLNQVTEMTNTFKEKITNLTDLVNTQKEEIEALKKEPVSKSKTKPQITEGGEDHWEWLNVAAKRARNKFK